MASSAGLFQHLEWASLDRFFRLRPREPVDERLVIVTINESDISKVGRWPIPDEVLAEALEKIKARDPRVIGLDLYRDLPVEPGHRQLVEVLKSTPNLLGVEKVVGEKVAPPPSLEQQERVAIADLVLDGDGKVRRALISVRLSGKTKLSLGTQLALMYLQGDGIIPETIPGSSGQMRLGKATFMPFQSNDGAYVRANAGGYQILLNFRGPRESFAIVSLTELLKDRIPPDLMRDRIVLIGATGQSLNDLFGTPYSSGLLTSPRQTPGVVIHANLISQILSGALDGRAFIQVWPELSEWLWVLVWSFIGAAGPWQLKNNVLAKWTVGSVFAVLAGGTSISITYLAFLWGWWIPAVSPLVAITGSAIVISMYYSRELQHRKADLEILLETTAEHADAVADDLRAKAEEALRESERRLAQFLEAVPVGIGVIDATGKPVFMNSQAKDLLGKGLAPDATPAELSEVYQNYIAGTDKLYPPEKLPIMRALRGEYTSADDIEIHQGDKIIPIEAWGTPIYDGSGKITYALVAFKDITERKKAELERQKLTEKMLHLNRAYERFVPSQFLDFLDKDSIIDVELGDNVQQEMSILFSDIRDFTAMSEKMTPEDNFKFINAYLSRMEAAIAENQGFIDKYIGDAIMALFSGLGSRGIAQGASGGNSSADNAVRAGIAMLEKVAEYNVTRGRPKRPKLKIGIGINTGSLMLGTVGGSGRMDGTVISDAVNLAARIESLTKDYGVSLLISHHTLLQLENPDDYAIRLIDRVKVKGKAELVTVYEAFDADPLEMREGKLTTKTMFEQALVYYHMGEIKAAAEMLKNCLRLTPWDKVAQIYLESVVRRIYD
ncbi:MAG: CHASE2 domain-containing protein [Hormoscilla sp.]